jgi:hypothetical protein
VHEWLTAKDAKETIPHRFGFSDSFVGSINFDPVLLRPNIDPTPLTAQIATINHRHVQERWKELPFLQTPLMPVHTPQASCTQSPRRFPKQTFISFFEESLGESQVHGQQVNRFGELWVMASISSRWQAHPQRIVPSLLY